MGNTATVINEYCRVCDAVSLQLPNYTVFDIQTIYIAVFDGRERFSTFRIPN